MLMRADLTLKFTLEGPALVAVLSRECVRFFHFLLSFLKREFCGLPLSPPIRAVAYRVDKVFPPVADGIWKRVVGLEEPSGDETS